MIARKLGCTRKKVDVGKEFPQQVFTITVPKRVKLAALGSAIKSCQ